MAQTEVTEEIPTETAEDSSALLCALCVINSVFSVVLHFKKNTDEAPEESSQGFRIA